MINSKYYIGFFTNNLLYVLFTALLEKPDKKIKKIIKPTPDKDNEAIEGDAEKDSTESVVKTEKEGDETGKEDDKEMKEDDKTEEEDASNKPNEEDVIKVIRYLLAAGCDVNFPVSLKSKFLLYFTQWSPIHRLSWLDQSINNP